jgi:hypothetical protein
MVLNKYVILLITVVQKPVDKNTFLNILQHYLNSESSDALCSN